MIGRFALRFLCAAGMAGELSAESSTVSNNAWAGSSHPPQCQRRLDRFQVPCASQARMW